VDLSFLIPTKIESEDRLRNVCTVLAFLLKNFDAQILIKEVDDEQNVKQFVFPLIYKRFGGIPDNLHYFYEKPTKEYFHKTKILNDLIEASETSVVANYDTDVILPTRCIQAAYELIANGTSDAVYPYAVGPYQKAVKYSPKMFDEFFNSPMGDDDIATYLERDISISSSTIGWCQFIRKRNYIDSFMMNESFAAWGPEDCELHYRLLAMGNKVDRIQQYVYHLEHSRTQDSWFNNPKWQENMKLWEWIRTQDREQLSSYYRNQEYVKERIVNAGI
tara:strand:+ start:1498 stop:2325 length:828 start_codon:yes stop_codon:yes gene_type:complete